jgi:hypothetical protein
MVRVVRRIEPDPVLAAAMDRRAALWTEMQTATASAGRRLAP